MPDSTTIAKADAAPLGREPLLLGIDHVMPEVIFANQRYRTEAWRLTDGTLAVIVTDNNGTSLMNGSEHIAAAIDARWHTVPGQPPTIIEDWGPGGLFGARFVISDRKGGYTAFSFDEWDSRGLALPR